MWYGGSKRERKERRVLIRRWGWRGRGESGIDGGGDVVEVGLETCICI
jgi:hypothetical protein